MKQKERREGEGDDDGDRRTVGGGLESFSPSLLSIGPRRRETITPGMLRAGLVWLSTCGGAEAASNLIMETVCYKGRARDIQLVSTGTAASSYSLLTTANPGRNANCS